MFTDFCYAKCGLVRSLGKLGRARCKLQEGALRHVPTAARRPARFIKYYTSSNCFTHASFECIRFRGSRMAPSRAETLAKLRALRASGKTAFDVYQVQEADDVYETVDEEGYKKVVRSRLDQDDFVVDDNGAGYADDGREDWQDEKQPMSASESEDELPKNTKACRYLHLVPQSDH